MIKGVSRYAVEIDKTDSPFFEKVICFVRPQYAEGNSVDLHREAVRLVNNISSGVEEAQTGTRHVLRVQPQQSENYRVNYPNPTVQQNRVSGTRAGGSKQPVLPKWIPMVLSAGGGAAAAILITALI